MDKCPRTPSLLSFKNDVDDDIKFVCMAVLPVLGPMLEIA